MSTPINNIVRSVAPKSIFESAKAVVTSAVTFNQGDLIAFDTVNYRLKAVTADTDAPNFLGVARQTIVSGVVKSPYQGTAVDAAAAIDDITGPVYGVVASLILKTGDAFTPGCKVYLTADAQTVTVTDPGTHDPIGVYQGKNVASATAGQKGEILVGSRFGGALVF